MNETVVKEKKELTPEELKAIEEAAKKAEQAKAVEHAKRMERTKKRYEKNTVTFKAQNAKLNERAAKSHKVYKEKKNG